MSKSPDGELLANGCRREKEKERDNAAMRVRRIDLYFAAAQTI
jgi:hypothetical protein